MKRSEKLPKLVKTLLTVVGANGTKIKRYELKRVVMFTLEIKDPHIVNNWVETLLFQKLISSTTSEFKKPSRNTLYLIDIKKCESL